ncbi:hypothetical protein, partial [Mesorhizobium sp. M2A.F.Ca.ET.037.01.1.1]|uniref:hypothetical protein n=1 Tax=Mesorhizobium sp. M2A.F.Ca.ET.037.01.1.1 TaxID=2496748 RepID=UPI001AECB436
MSAPSPLIRATGTESGRLTKAKKRLAWSIERTRAVEHLVIFGRSERNGAKTRGSMPLLGSVTDGAEFGMALRKEPYSVEQH